MKDFFLTTQLDNACSITVFSVINYVIKYFTGDLLYLFIIVICMMSFCCQNYIRSSASNKTFCQLYKKKINNVILSRLNMYDGAKNELKYILE